MPRIIAAAAAVVIAFLPLSAQAKHHHHHHYRGVYDAGTVVPHYRGCPWRASCGCIASVKVFGHPVRDLFLASNWFRFPRAAPSPGMAAVRHGHVFVIEAVNGDGTVVAFDGNSGHHQTRIHNRSLRGFTVVNPTRMATR